MSAKRAVLVLGVLLTACGPAVSGTWRGPALVTLTGQLTVKEGLVVSEGVRLAIAWYPDLGGDVPRAPRAIATEELAYTGTFPQRFTFRLHGPPAKEALEPVPREDGTVGEAAVGQLLAYEDVDGDGRLTVDATGHSPDRILGATAGAGPFDFFSSAQRDIVAWVGGADDLGLIEQGMKPGYNLLRASSPLAAPAVLPAETPIALQLTGDPRLQLVVCPEAYLDGAEEACGVRVWAAPAVNGTLTLRDDGGLDALVLLQPTGQPGPTSVTVNGVALPTDDSGLAFSLSEDTPSVLKVGANVVTVQAPGYPLLTLPVTVPGPFALRSPLPGARLAPGGEVEVTWTASAGATLYAASLFVLGPGSTDSAFTPGLSARVKVPTDTGQGELSVTAWDRFSLSRTAVFGVTMSRVSVEVGN